MKNSHIPFNKPCSTASEINNILAANDLKKFSANKSLRQFATYSIIGIITNATGYLLYLTLTYFWEQPILAMTILYCLGATLGFFPTDAFLSKVVDILELKECAI